MTATAVNQPESAAAVEIPKSLVLVGTTTEPTVPWQYFDDVRKHFNLLLVDQLLGELLLFLKGCPTISEIGLALEPSDEYNDNGGTYLCWNPSLSVVLTGPIDSVITIRGSTIDLSDVEDPMDFDEATCDWRNDHLYDEKCEALNSLCGTSIKVKRTDVEHFLSQPQVDLIHLRALVGIK